MATAHVQYKPGQDITVKAAEALAPGRFVQAGAYVDGTNITAVYCDGGAGTVPIGVTAQDIADTKIGHVVRRGAIMEVELSATLAANALISVTTDGKAAAATATGAIVVGKLLRGGDNGDLCLADLFSNPAVLKIA